MARKITGRVSRIQIEQAWTMTDVSSKILLGEATFQRLKRYCEEHRLTMSDFIEERILEFLDSDVEIQELVNARAYVLFAVPSAMCTRDACATQDRRHRVLVGQQDSASLYPIGMILGQGFTRLDAWRAAAHEIARMRLVTT